MAVKKQANSPEIAKGSCAGAEVCPLSRVPVGSIVCIKSFAASPAVRDQLRALGFCEEQQVKLLSESKSNFVCEVCDAELDLNAELAEAILVAPLALPVRQLQNFMADAGKSTTTKPLRMALRIFLLAMAAVIAGVLVWQG